MPNKLTIALMTYNRCQYLGDALESVLGQTYEDFDLLVLDNGSTDDTAQVVAAHGDSRLTYIRHPEGHGPTYNAESALRFCRTKRILWAHDDDILEADMVEMQMAMMDKNPGMVAVATNVSMMDEQGRITQPQMLMASNDMIFKRGEYLDFFLRNKFVWPASAVMALAADSRLHQAVVKKSTKTSPYGDILYTCRLNAKGSYGFLARPLLRYRMHGGQDSANFDMAQSEHGLLKALKGLYDLEPSLRANRTGIEVSLIRCRVYKKLMTINEARQIPNLKSWIARMRPKWEKDIPIRTRPHDALMPVEILLILLDIESFLPSVADPLARMPPVQDPCPIAFRAWFRCLNGGGGLFKKSFPHRRVAILGSAFTAFLMVLEAKRAGIIVVCCLESKSYRHEDKVLGIPIVAHEWLRKHAMEVDAVLLSSERNYDEHLESLVQSYCEGRPIPVISWKTLAT